jgi:hypothetical protein
MWCLFQRKVLYNIIVHSELIGGCLILPWRCSDHYPIEIIQSFLWKPVYGRTPYDLLNYMDFWYDQYFNNPLIEFKSTDNMGIGVFAKQCGTLLFLSDGLIVLLEFITEEQYNHHWSLYKYNISWDTIAYTIVYGTVCLLNDNMNSTTIFHVQNSIPGALEACVHFSTSPEERVIYNSIDDVHIDKVLKLTYPNFDGDVENLQNWDNHV